MLALMVLVTALRATGQCPTVLVFNPSNPDHTNLSTILSLDIKEDFCALGNGTDNDQAAFEAASTFIKKRGGYTKLVIPAGTYRVGRQAHGFDGWYDYPVHVLPLEFVKNVTVTGIGMPTIQYVDGLRYGYFDPATDLPTDIDIFATGNLLSYTARVGDMFRIVGAENIAISNLRLDGNLYPGKMVIGGRHNNPAHFVGIQEGYSGFDVLFSRGIHIDNVIAKRFGLDGFLLEDHAVAGSPKAGLVYLNNFHADSNGRQGASFVGGDSIFVNGSSFKNSGMGEITYSGLQAGIDIEPDQLGQTSRQFFFTDCLFENNRNTNISIISGVGYVEDVYFLRCKSINIGQNGNTAPTGSTSFNNIALDIGARKNLNFTDCEFYGYVLISKGYSGNNSAEDGNKFMRCLFTDCYQKKVNWYEVFQNVYYPKCSLVRQHISNISTPLMYAPARSYNNIWEYVTIDSSVFDVYDRRPWLNVSASIDKPSIIKNSTVYINSPSGPGSPIVETVVLSDTQLLTSNLKVVMYSNQRYIHDGVEVAGPSGTTTSWGSDVFHRWYDSPYGGPNECIDSMLTDCDTLLPPIDSNLTNAMRKGALKSTANAGYQLYPNPARANRFDLRNLDGTVLYFELLSANGRSIARGSVAGYTTQGFNLPQLSAGIYYLKIIQANAVRVEKIVLQP